MGIFSKAANLLNSYTNQSYPLATESTAYALEPQIQSPWTPTTLQTLFFPDQTILSPITVFEAMSLPAVSAGVGIISGLASRLPLNGPDWLNSRDAGALDPQLRIAKTVEDLIFFNYAIWVVVRDNDDYVEDAVRVDPHRVFIDVEGNVHIDGYLADQSKILFIPGPKPIGFLESARFTVRHALALQQTILNRATNPSPVVLIKETDANTQATEAEIAATQNAYKLARQNDGGGTVFVPFGLEVTPFGSFDDGAMLINAREAVRTDLAGHLGIDAEFLNGSQANSQVYKNEQQSIHSLLEISIKLWTERIAARLSQNDVTPPDVTVDFDYTEFEDTGVVMRQNAQVDTGVSPDEPAN